MNGYAEKNSPGYLPHPLKDSSSKNQNPSFSEGGIKALTLIDLPQRQLAGWTIRKRKGM